jgi:undecaprenyl-diphosphatase
MTGLKRLIHRFDAVATQWIMALPWGSRPILAGLSEVGHPVAVAVVGAALVAVAVLGGQPALQWATGLAFLALPLSAVLKRSFRRMRPETAHMVGLHNYSFPSGHSYGSTIVYGLLAVLAATRLPGLMGLGVAWIFGLLVFAIGLSRVYLGAHYPSDVVGGWLLGLIGLAGLGLMLTIARP